MIYDGNRKRLVNKFSVDQIKLGQNNENPNQHEQEDMLLTVVCWTTVLGRVNEIRGSGRARLKMEGEQY